MADKSKGGRPKAEDPKNKTVTIRVTAAEYDRLMQYSEKRNMTMTQVLLDGLEKVYSEIKL